MFRYCSNSMCMNENQKESNIKKCTQILALINKNVEEPQLSIKISLIVHNFLKQSILF